MSAAAAPVNVLVDCPHMFAAAASGSVLVACPRMSVAAASGSAVAACPRRTAVDLLEAELAAQLEAPPELDDLPRPAGTPMQKVLRQALRSCLDCHIRPVIPAPDGAQVVLDRADMVAMYKRRRAHIQGYRTSLRWAIVRAKKSLAALAALPHGHATGCICVLAFHRRCARTASTVVC